MTYCKGRGCRYRKQCARYRLRLAEHESDTWIDHCIDAKKFIKFEENIKR